ncbi:ATP-binding cassette domain-containing protein [Leucobacter allii]|uniref:ATP-binding cassette domain-containing protein n=1 Tax=Leucobacter allii TaxID=2932247 RepID=A0ABY4FL38_9MICO|nr:ATP-binding cassette domain-containing protein [Leucobacter allii]UOQ56987.1 ATP-binding cassette domain-containing protein [Leucobacter allii]UOR01457.1 ATP-binding cassette domain-containing protein [Leucobacter allii]
MSDADTLVEVERLRYAYPVRRALFSRAGEREPAVDEVSFTIARGEIVALVGESGSGKSTIGRLILGMLRPDAGHVRFAGQDVHALGRRASRAHRHNYQMVFQDPYSSLNPRMRVGDAVAEALAITGELPAEARRAAAEALLGRVHLDPEVFPRLPAELSGGQRQRVGIARALAARPQLLVADEALASLDVSIQAQVAQVLAELNAEEGLSMLFITHDLAMARRLASRIIVLNRGRIVEEGPTGDVIRAPRDAYTRALIDAVPIADPVRARARQRERVERERLLRRTASPHTPTERTAP